MRNRWGRGRWFRPMRCRRQRLWRRTFGFLSEWWPGAEGVVADVVGSSGLAARLRELGVTPGQHVRVLRGGNPLIVQVGSSRLGIRRQDAAAVLVQATGEGVPYPGRGPWPPPASG